MQLPPATGMLRNALLGPVENAWRTRFSCRGSMADPAHKKAATFGRRSNSVADLIALRAVGGIVLVNQDEHAADHRDNREKRNQETTDFLIRAARIGRCARGISRRKRQLRSRRRGGRRGPCERAGRNGHHHLRQAHQYTPFSVADSIYRRLMA
ncbi:hypothetical protein DdX_20376 [Ditylenchus destructor]|uniref:Uncharacterized protein n=1 Tax=Ditylenchus destructor TaxID=166010 RepID=A0AAD4MI46_9BILA|nr:hypothetical protein DdX_20376 [Ditylenchus destructor]